jgi:hypothetical protein
VHKFTSAPTPCVSLMKQSCKFLARFLQRQKMLTVSKSIRLRRERRRLDSRYSTFA